MLLHTIEDNIITARMRPLSGSVKATKAHREYMPSALHPNPDIARHSRYFAFGPDGEVGQLVD
jgi:hypothetical protein